MVTNTQLTLGRRKFSDEMRSQDDEGWKNILEN